MKRTSFILFVLGFLGLLCGVFGCSPPKQETRKQGLCATDNSMSTKDSGMREDAPDVECPSLCEDGQTRCGDSCVETSSDTMNCGACGNTCDQSFECQAGVCACPQGTSECGGACLDFETDENNCGSCGNVCPEQIGCVQGECKCPEQEKVCGGVCVDVAKNEANCGACGNTCAIGCEDSTCIEIVSLGTSGEHTCVVLSDGDVYCWGVNDYGELGLGMPSTAESTPHKATVFDAYHAKQVVVGRLYTCILDDQGKVYCVGSSNSFGPLPPNPTTAVEVPITGTTVASLSGGRHHVCALGVDGKGFCWGYGGYGRLGDLGSEETVKDPVQIQGLGEIVYLDAGDSQTCAIAKEGGRLYCWGYNSNASLGISGDSVIVQPDSNKLSSDRPFVQVATSRFHTCAIDTVGRIHCAGENAWSQAGQSNVGEDVVPLKEVESVKGETVARHVEVGVAHTCALFRNQTVGCWGNNGDDQLGGGYHRVSSLISRPLVGPRDIELLSGTIQHICAASKQELYCWGKNTAGQLGLGHQDPSYGPRLVNLQNAWDKNNP